MAVSYSSLEPSFFTFELKDTLIRFPHSRKWMIIATAFRDILSGTPICSEYLGLTHSRLEGDISHSAYRSTPSYWPLSQMRSSVDERDMSPEGETFDRIWFKDSMSLLPYQEQTIKNLTGRPLVSHSAQNHVLLFCLL